MAGKIIHNLKRKRQEESEQRSRSSSVEGPTSQESKRERLQNQESSETQSARQSFLLDALQKIAELQSQLENDAEFEDDFEDYSEDEDSEVSFYLNEKRRHEAEAIGFAMCARETLLFLQKEGIPENSAIYQSLREKLVGKSDGVPI